MESATTLLLEAVENNDCEKIQDLVSQDSDLINHKYEEHFERTILTIACYNPSKRVEPKTVKCLLEHGAQIDFFGRFDLCWTALHYSIAKNRPDLARVLIEHDHSIIEKTSQEGYTALHIAIIRTAADHGEEAACTCITLLYEHKINVNCLDNKNRSAIFIAASKEFKLVVKHLLDLSFKYNVNIILDHESGNTTARKLIVDNNLYEGNLPNETEPELNDVQMLFYHLRNKDESKFLTKLEELHEKDSQIVIDAEDTNETLLQVSCKLDLAKSTEELLKKGVNPYKFCKKHKDYPIQLAIGYSNYKPFELLLLNHYVKDKKPIPYRAALYLTHDTDNKKLLQLVIDKIHEGCTFLLNLNECNEEDHNYTILHYLVRYANKRQTVEILNMGASLAVKNKNGNMPIQDIHPAVLTKHLNSCISVDSKVGMFDSKEYKLKFDFATLLLPPRSEMFIEEDETEMTIEVDEEVDVEIVPETDVVLFISKSPEYRKFLNHPILVAFILLKWYKLRWFFRINVALYIIFFVSLILYSLLPNVILNYKSDDFTNNTCVYLSDVIHDEEVRMGLIYVCKIILFISLPLLISREIFQMISGGLKYLKDFENYLEIILIGFTVYVLNDISPTCDMSKNFSSISVLISAFELILIFGQHPDLSVKVIILRKVLYNFFILFLMYAVLIIAFIFSFYLLFSGTSPKNNEVFGSLSDSIFKTIVMISGELNSGDMDFLNYLSRVIFCLFIFLIPIVLLNLLLGSAVSDIQNIEKDAQLVSLAARAKYISDAEDIMLSFKKHFWDNEWAILMYNYFFNIRDSKNETKTEIFLYNGRFELPKTKKSNVLLNYFFRPNLYIGNHYREIAKKIVLRAKKRK